MGNGEIKPSYMKLRRDLYSKCLKLPYPQSAKLLFALVQLFMDGVEPGEKDLPGRALDKFDDFHGYVLTWRKNVLNGSKNQLENRMENNTVFEIGNEQ